MKTSGGKPMRVRANRTTFTVRRLTGPRLSKDELRKLGTEAMKSHPIHVIPQSFLDATMIIDNLKKSMLHMPVNTGDMVGHFFTKEDGTPGSRKD
jgi:hypothetical protein